MKKCILLLSGGLDSATVLAMVLREGWSVHALSFEYGQRHARELEAARYLANQPGVLSHHVLNVPVGQIGGSSLTDFSMPIPQQLSEGIPNTYVPARNLIFLSFAASLAEAQGVSDIFLGVNAVDYSGYPDCRPAFLESFERTVALGTKAWDKGGTLRIHAPLLHLTKVDIIKKGLALGVDYKHTISCYQIDEQGLACGVCDSCRLRLAGFEQAGTLDPAGYQVEKASV